MPRQARLDSLGALHHVMIRGIEVRSNVEDDQDRWDVVRQMGEGAGASGTAASASAFWTFPTPGARLINRVTDSIMARRRSRCDTLIEYCEGCYPFTPTYARCC